MVLKHKGKIAFALIAGCFLLAFLIGPQRMPPISKERQAKIMCGMFAALIDEYETRVGEFPDSFDVLRVKPSHVAEERWVQKMEGPVPLDPWGETYQFAKIGSNCKVWSFGPDRTEGTEDDISN